jgi:hypothetical protein
MTEAPLVTRSSTMRQRCPRLKAPSIAFFVPYSFTCTHALPPACRPLQPPCRSDPPRMACVTIQNHSVSIRLFRLTDKLIVTAGLPVVLDRHPLIVSTTADATHA